MSTPVPVFEGDIFATELRAVIQRLGLLNVVTARAVPALAAVRLVWIHGAEAIDFPASAETAKRLREALEIYAERRRS